MVSDGSGRGDLGGPAFELVLGDHGDVRVDATTCATLIAAIADGIAKDGE